MQWVDVAADDGQAEIAELVAQLRCLHAKADARIVARIVVGGLEAGEAGLGRRGQGPPRVAASDSRTE